jgi:hypothetical protein
MSNRHDQMGGGMATKKAASRQPRQVRAQQKPGEDPLMSSEDLAEYLQVPVATTHVWASRASGPRFLKVGRYRRYHPADVQAWLNEQASRPAPDAA